MRELNKIAESLFEKIRDRFDDVSLGDSNAKATQNPEEARIFNFDYTIDDINCGTITISIIDEMSLKVYFSKNISRDLGTEEKQKWYGFLKELREFAKRNMLSFEPRDITRSALQHRDLKQVSKSDSTFSKDEVIGESKEYQIDVMRDTDNKWKREKHQAANRSELTTKLKQRYGNKTQFKDAVPTDELDAVGDVIGESRLHGTQRSSYENDGNVRIIVRHSENVNLESKGARTRNIKSIFVETAEGERFKLPHNNLKYARAVARHISEGGQLSDEFGQHITKIAEECGKLRPFKSAMVRRTFEDTETQSMVEAAFEYHALLNNTLKKMSGRKGYAACKENFVADDILMDGFDAEALRERFVKRTFNTKMEDALPLIYKAQEMKKQNKFAQQFESWANTIAEGSWALPDETDLNELAELLAEPLEVGVDATNATGALYNIIGDDILFDRLGDLAEDNPEADARETVMSWLYDNMPEIYTKLLDMAEDVDSERNSEGELEFERDRDEPEQDDGSDMQFDRDRDATDDPAPMEESLDESLSGVFQSMDQPLVDGKGNTYEWDRYAQTKSAPAHDVITKNGIPTTQGDAATIAGKWKKFKTALAMTKQQLGVIEESWGTDDPDFDRYFSELVPRSGPSKFVEGECLRSANRLCYDYYNNGFGNNVSGALNYLQTFLGNMGHDIHSEASTLYPYVRGNNNNMDEPAIKQALASVMAKTLDVVKSAEGNYHPNNGDLFDYQDPDDRYEEEEDDRYEEDDLYDYDDNEELDESTGGKVYTQAELESIQPIGQPNVVLLDKNGSEVIEGWYADKEQAIEVANSYPDFIYAGPVDELDLYLPARTAIDEGKNDVYTIDCERKGRVHSQTGTLAELIQSYSYTLEVGKSYERERGNAKINLNPKTIDQLVRNLNNAKNNSAANGYSGVHYSVGHGGDDSSEYDAGFGPGEAGNKMPVIEEEDDDYGRNTASAVASAITRRIMNQRLDLLSKFGPEAVGNAVDDVAAWNDDVQEIGSSDVSAWVDQVARQLEHSKNVNESIMSRKQVLSNDEFADTLAQMRKIAGLK